MAGYTEGTRYQGKDWKVKVVHGEAAAELMKTDIPDSQELRAG